MIIALVIALVVVAALAGYVVLYDDPPSQPVEITKRTKYEAFHDAAVLLSEEWNVPVAELRVIDIYKKAEELLDDSDQE